MSSLYTTIKQQMVSDKEELAEIARYYFDGQGKAFRPMIIMLVAKALNVHNSATDKLLPGQHQVALISEMIHTASLLHDDVIDDSDTRRSKPSVHVLWGQRKAILAGDFILSVASIALARIRNEQVVSILSQVIEDLVRGEFMQLGSKENEDERFKHYLTKTFKKTASLIANSCKAVAVLGNCTEDVTEVAFQYGRNIGIAFQLIDDLLDFTSCDSIMGKPTTADLRLGLATAPVLFAAQEHSELNALIMRRFSEPGDVETARELVGKSGGVRETRMLAEFHSQEAVRLLQTISDSSFKNALQNLAPFVLTRQK
jgi:decaprenyl-diphosphate synthase subunit 1